MKKIIIILCLVLLSGCSVNYNLDITSSKVKETMEFDITETDYQIYNDNNEEKLSATLYEYFDEREILAFDNMNYKDFHKKNLTKGNRSLNVKYSYDYTYLDFYNSYAINNCFEDYVVLNEDDYFYIKAYGKFNCYYDDTYINIKTDRRVINQNADSYKDGVYTWKITKDKMDNVNILFQVEKDEVFEEPVNEENKSIDFMSIIGLIFGFILLIGLGIYLKKANK